MTRPLKKSETTRNLLLFLDYDGTLVPIKKRPELALLHPSKRKILENLSKRYFLTLVTGRTLKNIKAMVKIKKIAYIGNHGLEIFFQGKYWVHPKAEKISRTLKNTLKGINGEIKKMPGVWVENKGLTASIHYRSGPENQKSILKSKILDEIAASKGLLKCTEGKKVFEIRPNIDWDKGRGIKKLLQDLAGPPSPGVNVYIGDDDTDEDAFKALGQDGVTILVGPKRKSHASYIFTDVDMVWKFLKQLNHLEIISDLR